MRVKGAEGKGDGRSESWMEEGGWLRELGDRGERGGRERGRRGAGEGRRRI